MDAFVRWLGRHQALTWAGLVLGIAEVLASPRFGLTSLPGIVLLVMGGVLVGGFGGSMIALRRRKHRVECLECVQSYEFSGTRGSTCQFTVAMLVRAKARVESFVHSKIIAGGKIQHLTTTFRNLGRDGRKNPSPPPVFALRSEHLFETTDAGEGATLRIVAPAPLRKHDHVEVVRKVCGTDCFPSLDEFVEKVALFPIRKLRFELNFGGGLGVTDCCGTKLEAGVPVEEGFQALTPTAGQPGTQLIWEVAHVRPSESYRVAWRWV